MLYISNHISNNPRMASLKIGMIDNIKIQTNIKKNDELVGNIIKFLKKHDIVVDKNFSIIVNRGPGSFSSIRVSLSVAKGIQISKGAKLYGYKDSSLCKFDAKNINLLIEKSLLESKLIKPIYLS